MPTLLSFRLAYAVLALLLLAGGAAWLTARPQPVSPVALAAPSPERTAGRRVWPGPFAIDISGVHDGDTLRVHFREGPFGETVRYIRLRGMDAPETRLCRRKLLPSSAGSGCARCPQEQELGRAARAYLADLIAGGGAFRASQVRPDKYFARVIADVDILTSGQWVSLAAMMLSTGHAIPYDGRRKSKPWCPPDASG